MAKAKQLYYDGNRPLRILLEAGLQRPKAGQDRNTQKSQTLQNNILKWTLTAAYPKKEQMNSPHNNLLPAHTGQPQHRTYTKSSSITTNYDLKTKSRSTPLHGVAN